MLNALGDLPRLLSYYFMVTEKADLKDYLHGEKKVSGKKRRGFDNGSYMRRRRLAVLAAARQVE